MEIEDHHNVRFSTVPRLLVGVALATALLQPGSMQTIDAAPKARLVTLMGTIVLPSSIDPVNLFRDRYVPQVGHAHGMGVEHDPGGTPPHPNPSTPRLPLSKILQVQAIAIPPPDGDTRDYSIRNEDGPIHITSAEFPGQVDDSGSFEIQVPEYRYGYFITMSGDKVQLSHRLRGRVRAGSPPDPITLSIPSTLIALVSQAMGPQGRRLTNDQIAQRLGSHLAAESEDLARALGAPGFLRAAWRQAAQELAAGLQGVAAAPSAEAAPGEVPPVFTTTGCVPATTPGMVGTGCATHNLMSADEMPSASTTHIPFGWTGLPILASSRRLYDQHSSDGVRFVGYPAKPLGGGSSSVTEVRSPTGCNLPGSVAKCRSYVRVDPGPLSRILGGGVTLDFTLDSFAASGIKAIGMHIQNGDTHDDSTGAFPRRGVKVTALDQAGGLIHQYRWYTHQKAAAGGFYGITSETPIYKLRISVSGGDPFTIDDLYLSPEYVDLSDHLGWRTNGADGGQWVLADNGGVSHADTSGCCVSPMPSPGCALNGFCHTDRREAGLDALGGSSECDDDYSVNFTGSNHWVAEHPAGGSTESTLMSPGYSLTNLDVDEDDVLGRTGVAPFLDVAPFDMWAIGIDRSFDADTLTSWIDAMSDSDLSFCTIPATPPSCGVSPWDSLKDNNLHSATSETHWSHVHWQNSIEVESCAEKGDDPSCSTARYVEYSTDNGATWRNAWWWHDENHRGRNRRTGRSCPDPDEPEVWWNSHMHPFMDSYMNDTDFDEDGTINTDFDKDPNHDYEGDFDWEQGTSSTLDTGCQGGDMTDCREWDTEFYYDYVNPPGEGDGDPNSNCGAASSTVCDDVDDKTIYEVKNIEGMTIVYRFRFVTTGVAGIWRIDDVALSSDDEGAGYYTDFDKAVDRSQQ